jgi:hypothetical protein
MLCKKVLRLQSQFLDEVLDADTTVQVSQHLAQCARCRKEFDSLSKVHGKLRSLKGVRAPAYLHNLIEHRLAGMHQNSWLGNLQNGLERRWSIIRTTEGMWFVSKALGTVMTCLFFIVITSSAIPPIYNAALSPAPANIALKRTIQSAAAINDGWLYNVGESMSSAENDNTFSVLVEFDSSGSATIQEVLGDPGDQNVVSKIKEMFSLAHCRPASENGKAVSSHNVYIFSKAKVTAHD